MVVHWTLSHKGRRGEETDEPGVFVDSLPLDVTRITARWACFTLLIPEPDFELGSILVQEAPGTFGLCLQLAICL